MTDAHKKTLRQLILLAREVDALTFDTFSVIGDDRPQVIEQLAEAEEHVVDVVPSSIEIDEKWYEDPCFGTISALVEHDGFLEPSENESGTLECPVCDRSLNINS